MQNQSTIPAAKILQEDQNTAIIGLYGVVYGGKDLYGDHFHSETDFKLDRVKGAPVLIDHTFETYVEHGGNLYKMEGITDEVGEIIDVSPDNLGLYMQLQFEKSNEYWPIVEGMLNTGKMGASTGSDHRARIKDGRINLWPINEVSLTMTPAEPRTVDHVSRLRQYESMLRDHGYTEEFIVSQLEQAKNATEFNSEALQNHIWTSNDVVTIGTGAYTFEIPETITNVPTGDYTLSITTDNSGQLHLYNDSGTTVATFDPSKTDGLTITPKFVDNQVERLVKSKKLKLIETESEAAEDQQEGEMPVDQIESDESSNETAIEIVEKDLERVSELIDGLSDEGDTPDLEIEMSEEITVEVEDVQIEGINELQKTLKSVGESLSTINARLTAIENEPADEIVVKTKTVNRVQSLGDTATKAFASWVRTGDGGTVDAAQGLSYTGPRINVKASNDTLGNLTTAADGGNAVPTGHFNGIIARRDETMLSRTLGVRQIPGQGLTVNVPIDNEDDGEFIATSEQNDAYSNNFDRDMPAIGQKAFTLAKYTKKVALTDELLIDEDSRLMAFIEDFVGRGMAKTHNNLLITEVNTNGATLKTLAATNAIADGEVEDVEADDNLAAYLDNSGSVAWVMRNSTLGAIRKISGNDRVYSVESGGGAGVRQARQLIGYPVYHSQKIGALASGASTNVANFGNWNFVGMREAPSFQIIRDEISVDGVVLLKYYFRTVYGVLQSEAIGKVVTAAS